MEDSADDFFTSPMAAFNDTFVSDEATVTDSILGTPSGGNQSSLIGCGSSLQSFARSYRNFHGYTSLMVCLFGAQANILNLIVLTRREMINPTNAILTGLALADLLNMLEYIPYALYFIIPGRKTTYAWALFVLIHSNFSQVCHTISIWLTVTLAVWRYIMVAMHVRCKTLCTMDRAKWAIGSAYITSPLLCIPIYLSFSITPLQMPTSSPSSAPITLMNETSTLSADSLIVSTMASFLEKGENATMMPSVATLGLGNSTKGATQYIVNLSEMAKNTPLWMQINFWAYSVVIKLIPCVLLTVVSLRLINSLMIAKKRKQALLKKRTASPAAVSVVGNSENSTNVRSANTQGSSEPGSDRTTRMLLAVLLLFLITEFPQGMLGLLSGVLGDDFFKSCYIPLADMMDFVALANSAINFILYCSMSRKFRDTFSELFKLNRLMKLVRRQRGTSRRRVHNTATKPVPILNHSHQNNSPNAIHEIGNSPV